MGDTIFDEREKRRDNNIKKEETIKSLIGKAERSLEVAKGLFSEEHYDFSISRAYYAMFYCAEALLFSKDMSFSKHSAVISYFGKEFVKTGKILNAAKRL